MHGTRPVMHGSAIFAAARQEKITLIGSSCLGSELEKKAFPRRKPERDGRSREGFRHKHGRGLGENCQWVFVNNHSRQSTVRQCERTPLRTGSSRLSDCYICNRSESPVAPRAAVPRSPMVTIATRAWGIETIWKPRRAILAVLCQGAA